MKQNTIIFNDNTSIVKGSKALKVEPSTIVEVTDHKDVCRGNIGDILMRTSSNEHPFVNLENGTLWGYSLDNYTFRILPVNIINLGYEKENEKSS